MVHDVVSKVLSRQRLTHWIGAMRFSLALENHKEENGRQNDVEQSGERMSRMRVDIKYSLFHGPKEPLGFLIEGHSHPMKLGHLLCNLCRDAGIT